MLLFAPCKPLQLPTHLTVHLTHPVGPANDVEESGWKMVSGDVFRAPKSPIALCVHLGTGVQILLASGMTLLFAAMGM